MRWLPLVALLVSLMSAPAALPQGPTNSAPAMAQGLKVTYAPLEADRRRKEGAHSSRVRLLSCCVERTETPSPLLSPGMFEAAFAGRLSLSVRDRFSFQIEGKGSASLSVNGEVVLKGSLRLGKPLVTKDPVRLKKGDNLIELRFESTAAGDGQLRLLWSGADFAFEPIAPEMWQWPTDDAEIEAGERMRLGHQTLVERRCVQCHRSGEAQGAYARGESAESGPDLRTVNARLHPAFVARWLRDPKKARRDASMPRIRMDKDSDYDDVAAWLMTMGQPLLDQPFAEGAAQRGAARFLELGCIACHLPPEQGNAADAQHGRVALDFVPHKWRPTALVQFLLDPKRDYEHTAMPDFRLDAEDAQALAAYLLQGASAQQPEVRGDADNGRRLAQRHGCDRCHAMELPESGRRYQELRSLHLDHGCLGDDAKAPDFALSEAEKAGLRAFMPHAERALPQRAPMDYAARMLPRLRCANCHGLDGRASDWAQLAAAMGKDEPLPHEQDPVAQGVPALTWAASKLQPGWMERFVSGREPSPRPWLHARMPNFGERGAAVIAGLVRSHGYPEKDEPAEPPDAQLAVHGARLVKFGEGLACVQCHGVGAQLPVQVFERQGINFKIAAHRLRRDYYMRWMLDPMRVDPDARMPKFADANGKTAFVDVLDGDARRQFDAIWQWFRTL